MSEFIHIICHGPRFAWQVCWSATDEGLARPGRRWAREAPRRLEGVGSGVRYLRLSISKGGTLPTAIWGGFFQLSFLQNLIILVIVMVKRRCSKLRRSEKDGLRWNLVGGDSTRWSTTLSSKVNLPHAINFRALCGAYLVTRPSKFGGNETLIINRVAGEVLEKPRLLLLVLGAVASFLEPFFNHQRRKLLATC